jgi:Catalase
MGHPKFSDTPVYTASNGAPVFNPNASQRVGTSGPLLLQDFHLIDLLAHFDRERIPERYYSNSLHVNELTNDVVLSMPRVPVHMVSSR